MASDQQHDHPGLSITVEHPDETTARVTFTITREEFEKMRDRGLKNAARQTRMKGFRPGKTPKKIVEKAYGEQIEREVIEHYVNHAYSDALEEHALKPAAHPRIDVAQLARAEDGSFAHTFDVPLRPTFELGEYRGLRVESQPVTVDDEELEETLEHLRKQHARPEEAKPDEGLTESGMAVCHVVFTQEAVEEPVLDREGVRLSPTAPPTGVDEDAYREKMLGAKAGDVVEVGIRFPEQFPVESARGEQGTCRLEISEVFHITEPDDTELQRVLGMEDAEDFRAEVRQRLAEAKTEQEDRRVESALLDQLLEAHPMQIPPALVESQADSKVAELRQNLPEGLDDAEVEARLEEERAQAVAASTRAMKALYLIEAIAEAEELRVTNEDIRAELESIAIRNNASLEDVSKYYKEENLGQQLMMELLERKVRNLLRAEADRSPAA
ncbi:MAG: trigger factor [Planctomycetota bacterium]